MPELHTGPRTKRDDHIKHPRYVDVLYKGKHCFNI